MSSNIQAIITGILAQVKFADHTNLATRCVKIIVKNQISIIIDITGLSQNITAEKQNIALQKLAEKFPDQQFNIIFTSHKDSKSSTSAADKSATKIHLPHIKQVILVAAGKGGVGKSTISALLAHKLRQGQYQVGIIDADIYGPSIPHLFKLTNKPQVVDNKMVPLDSYGIKLNSIGLLTKPGAAISWRGPMTAKALYQLLSLTAWGELDYLIIDSPPGTGDIHLNLLQNYHIDQVIMVTTPQQLASLDVQRAIDLYKKFAVKIAGIIENMSYLVTDSGQKQELFVNEAAEHLAAQYSIPILSRVPLDVKLAKACDEGADLTQFTNYLDLDI